MSHVFQDRTVTSFIFFNDSVSKNRGIISNQEMGHEPLAFLNVANVTDTRVGVGFICSHMRSTGSIFKKFRQRVSIL